MRRERDIKQNKQKKWKARPLVQWDWEGYRVLGGDGRALYRGTSVVDGHCRAGRESTSTFVAVTTYSEGAPFQNFHYCVAFHSEDREVIALLRIHQIIIKYNLERLWDPEYEVRFGI
ncbi:hypothetical protein CEXT_10901 [Caerostris extrusa]|uniref:LAGLIDADG homing endonuclease n=1 Tax=Caerostris extrusa TaxID=172846 RepID=A0AAV4NQ16_CAEEX|nr:hypothetical protein CEXT_10901 [Caerostris extrusa]